MASLRNRYLSRFHAFEDLDSYIRLRALPGLAADATWFERYDEIPDSELMALINRWLAAEGAEALFSIQSQLLAVEIVREENRTRLRNFGDRYWMLVPAWLRKHRATSDVPELWRSSPKQRLVEVGLEEGWIDFLPLDDPAIVRWLAKRRHWPDGMPASHDLAHLELTAGDLTYEDDQLNRHKQEQRRRRTLINFAGKELSALNDGYQDLVSAVTAGMAAAQQLLNSPHKDALLEEFAEKDPKRGGSKGGTGGGSSSANPDNQMSDDQKLAIGLVGELIAREWLRKIYREQYKLELTDDCWVSRNRDRALGTKGGKDELGYDFVIALKSTRHYYEVKSTSGDPGIVDLGPTEIAAAQRYKRDDKDHFRILYLPWVLDPKNVRALVLPNPFSKRGSLYMRIVGTGGVKYRFAVRE